MRVFISAAIALGSLNLVCAAAMSQPPNVITLEGECTPDSHIAQGPIGADLTQRQSRLFCDMAVVSTNPQNGSIMFQFADRNARHQPVIGFAGGLDEPNMLTVERVYLRTGQPVVPNEGYCRLFFRNGASEGTLQTTESIVCGAQIDEDGQRTVPVISFRVR